MTIDDRPDGRVFPLLRRARFGSVTVQMSGNGVVGRTFPPKFKDKVDDFHLERNLDELPTNDPIPVRGGADMRSPWRSSLLFQVSIVGSKIHGGQNQLLPNRRFRNSEALGDLAKGVALFV